MRLLIDENMSDPHLAARLRKAGHDIALAGDAGLRGQSDPRVMIEAIGGARAVPTRDFEDLEDLHLLVLASGGHHPGILAVRFDGNPRHDLTIPAIVTAINNLQTFGLALTDGLHVLNHWK
jgi:predicted nuclease of predicted toxin-antitoxin system